VILALKIEKRTVRRGDLRPRFMSILWCLEPVFHPDSFEKYGKKRSLPREIRRE